MDRSNLSEGIIQELGSIFMNCLRKAGPSLAGSADLEALERQAQVIGRDVLGRVVEASIRSIAATTSVDRPNCPRCGKATRLVDSQRDRNLQGLVGDYGFSRAYYFCDDCNLGLAPLDDRLGLGPGTLSPALGRVVCWAGIQGSFEEGAAAINEALGVMVPTESTRRVTESVGAVAEQEQQAMIARAQAGDTPCPKVNERETPGVLLVEVDALKVHLEEGWRDAKVTAVVPLGAETVVDEDTGRERFVMGRQRYAAGFEKAELFWYRVFVEACRHGLGNLALTMVVVLGDGADWIWRYASPFLALSGIKLVEIVDIYHAWEHLWKVGNKLHGQGSPNASAWVEPLKAKLLEKGTGPVIEALVALGQQDGDIGEEIRKAIDYFTVHSERMRYPEFIALKLPIGSGVVESACKTVVGQREHGPGMRWSEDGAQRVATLRAIYRSGQWDTFWATRPMMRRDPRIVARSQARADTATKKAA